MLALPEQGDWLWAETKKGTMPNVNENKQAKKAVLMFFNTNLIILYCIHL